MEIDGLRPKVRVQYGRVSGLDSRIIAKSLIDRVLGGRRANRKQCRACCVKFEIPRIRWQRFAARRIERA